MSPKPQVSIIVTSSHEPTSLDNAIAAIIAQKLPQTYEIIIVSPDKETGEIVAKYRDEANDIHLIKDRGLGKPIALNLGLASTRGEIIVLTDGDVVISPSSLPLLTSHFSRPDIGAVSGHPVSLNSKNNMLGYWSHFLTDGAAHQLRWKKSQKGEFFGCSGYLFAFRRKLVDKIPPEALAEDALISSLVWKQKYRIVYESDAIVKVKFPTTVNDWIIQKLRTISAYNQPYLKNLPVSRSFLRESIDGIWLAITYAKSLKELIWTLILFAFRIYIWFRAWIEINLLHKSLADLWKPVKSTK